MLHFPKFDAEGVMSTAALIIITIISLYIILKVFNNRTSLVEGLVGSTATASKSEQIAASILNDNKVFKDALLMPKYYKNYESIIVDMEEWCNLQMVNAVVDNGINVNDGMSEANMKIVKNINDVKKMKDNLQDVMSYLDSQKNE
jgi:hypothetical protein